MLYLIAASILTFTTLADLESVTEEWIAPGVDISRETLVEFAEHGPMFEGESEPFVGCHVAFVEVNGEEKWRAVVVYTDRVVLFQEDQEPRKTLFDFEIDNCSFSESGKFIVLHDGGFLDTGNNALRINTETSESVFFDSELDDLLGYSDFWIWEDGSLVFIRALDWDAFNYRFFFLDSNLARVNCFDAQYPSNERFTESLFLFFYSNGLVCFSRQGELLWEQNLEYRSLAKPDVINDDILLTTYFALEIRSSQTGELKRTFPLSENTIGAKGVFLRNGISWLCSVTNSGPSGVERSLLSGFTNNNDVTSISDPYPNCSSIISSVSDSHLLLEIRHRQDLSLITSVITDYQFNPLYAYTLPSPRSLHPFLSGEMTYCKLSSSGLQLLCSTPQEINIVKIGE